MFETERIKEIEESGSDVEDTSTMDLVDAAYMYIVEQKYPEGCTDTKKSIRKKAKMFAIRDGVLYFKKKKKRMVGIILKLYILRIQAALYG